jgi:hypothetical protein
MRHLTTLAVAAAMILVAQIDRTNAEINTQPVISETPKGPLELSAQDKAAVIEAALDAKSHQKTPKDFTPTVGATVPRSLFLHGFKPDVIFKVPALKEYWYAYTDAEIALVDALQTQLLRSFRSPHRLTPRVRAIRARQNLQTPTAKTA